jgi:hypothetical protein
VQWRLRRFARSAVVGHEDRVPDEHRVADAVGNVSRRVARQVHDLDCEAAERQHLAVGQQTVELAAFAAHVFSGEHRLEDLLDLPDVLADRHLGAGLRLEMRRRGQVIGMGVRLQYPIDLHAALARLGQHAIG